MKILLFIIPLLLLGTANAQNTKWKLDDRKAENLKSQPKYSNHTEARDKIRAEFEEWLLKGEFEPTSRYEARVRDKAKKKFSEICSKVLSDVYSFRKSIEIEKKYNADAEYFDLKWKFGKREYFELRMDVPLDEAPNINNRIVHNTNYEIFVFSDYTIVDGIITPRKAIFRPKLPDRGTVEYTLYSVNRNGSKLEFSTSSMGITHPLFSNIVYDPRETDQRRDAERQESKLIAKKEIEERKRLEDSLAKAGEERRKISELGRTDVGRMVLHFVNKSSNITTEEDYVQLAKAIYEENAKELAEAQYDQKYPFGYLKAYDEAGQFFNFSLDRSQLPVSNRIIKIFIPLDRKDAFRESFTGSYPADNQNFIIPRRYDIIDGEWQLSSASLILNSRFINETWISMGSFELKEDDNGQLYFSSRYPTPALINHKIKALDITKKIGKDLYVLEWSNPDASGSKQKTIEDIIAAAKELK